MVKNPEFESKIRRAPNGEFMDKPGGGSSGVVLDEDIDAIVSSFNPYDRIRLAEQGQYLDVLANDSSPYVKAAVAEQGYRPDIFINDPSAEVRAGVVRACAAGHEMPQKVLDELRKDQDPWVREELANSGISLGPLQPYPNHELSPVYEHTFRGADGALYGVNVEEWSYDLTLLSEDGDVIADGANTQEWPEFYKRGWTKDEMHAGRKAHWKLPPVMGEESLDEEDD